MEEFSFEVEFETAIDNFEIKAETCNEALLKLIQTCIKFNSEKIISIQCDI